MKLLIETQDPKFNYHSKYCPHCLTLYLFKLIRFDLKALLINLRRDFTSDSIVIIEGTKIIDTYHMFDMEFRQCDLHINGSLFKNMVKKILNETLDYIKPLSLVFPDEFDKIIVKYSIIEYYKNYMDEFPGNETNFNLYL